MVVDYEMNAKHSKAMVNMYLMVILEVLITL